MTSLTIADKYLLYTKPFHQIKNLWETTKANAFPICGPVNDLFHDAKYGITAPFSDYPEKKSEEGFYSRIKNLSLHGIECGITQQHLQGCYALGSLPGMIISALGGYTIQAAAIALQIAKILLNLAAFAAINISAIAIATTALATDRVIRGLLYFSNKGEAYNSFIDKKLIDNLPSRYSKLAVKLRKYHPKPSAEIQKRHNVMIQELKENDKFKKQLQKIEEQENTFSRKFTKNLSELKTATLNNLKSNKKAIALKTLKNFCDSATSAAINISTTSAKKISFAADRVKRYFQHSS